MKPAILIGAILILLMACSSLARVPATAKPPAPEPTQISPKDGMTLLYVPAGEFMMGSNLSKDEKPVHAVRLDAFWIDRTEVTQGMYAKCDAQGCSKPTCSKGSEDFPAVCVDWYAAQAYCTWAGRRLPTEAEWEKAARGADQRAYPWGNAPASCEYAVMNDGSGNGCGKGDSAWAVGSKPKGASPYGALDMAGNVWEWVADWYGGSYYQVSPQANPTGPTSGENKVLRGGAWNVIYLMRSGLRYQFVPTITLDDFGFRCALSQ